MTTPQTLAVYQADIQPLQGRWARAWGRSLGAEKDITVERARQAVLAGAVTRCPADALPLLGADAQLEQLPGELDAAYRTRIAGAWDTWPWAGTRTGLLTVATQLGYPGAVLLTAAEWGVPLASTLWARWWLLVAPTDHAFLAEDAWGTGTWGDGGTWGSDATEAEVALHRRAFRQFTNARDIGWLRFAFNNTDYWGDPDGIFNHGKWGSDPAYVEWRV